MLKSQLLVDAQYRHANHYLGQLRDVAMLFEKNRVESAFKRFDEIWLQVQKGHLWSLAQDDERALELRKSFMIEGSALLELRQTTDERIAWAQAALDAALILGDEDAQFETYSQLSRLYLLMGDNKAGIAVSEQAYVLAQKHNNPLHQARSLNLLSNHLNRSGDYEQGRVYSEQSLAISLDIDDLRGVAMCYGNLGALEAQLGDYEKALDYHRKSLEVNREIDHWQGMTKSLNNIGSVLWSLGRFDEAEGYYEECLQIREAYDDEPGIADVMNNLGALAAMRGDFALARQRWERCLNLSQKHHLLRLIAYTQLNLGSVSRDLGDFAASVPYFEDAAEQLRTINSVFGLTIALCALGNVLLLIGKDNQARASKVLYDALHIAQERGTMPTVTWALVGFARLHALKGDYTHAAQLLGVVGTHKASQDSNVQREIKDLTTRLASYLSPDMLNAAKTQGEQQDLDAVITEYISVHSPS